ncbi:hypothetical protein S101447_01730 [Acetobacter ascendens]|uniref:Uncharacterized protein n=1 Tax=Acetobacter ascendens TaxID=481146 RepID=A0A1Y0V4G3_9PROT|nr:hypothetical protein S101447_01730 [Acetobacter ascendens]
MSAEHLSLPRTGLDRLIDVWLQMHDVLLPELPRVLWRHQYPGQFNL